MEQAKEIEVDPHGKSANETGAKLDAGKCRPILVLRDFYPALQEVSMLVSENNGVKFRDFCALSYRQLLEVIREMLLVRPMSTPNLAKAALAALAVTENKISFITNTTGLHNDTCGLLPVVAALPRAIWEVCEIGTFGASKYTEHGWLSVPGGINRYIEAAGRHLLKIHIEGDIDPDSRRLHTGQVAWNLLAVLTLTLIEGEEERERYRHE